MAQIVYGARLAAPGAAPRRTAARGRRSGRSGGPASASLTVPRPADAWIALPGSAKSMVWLNGFLLGRLWHRGPQVTLYAPAPLWHEGENTIVVLDTDRLGGTVEIREASDYGDTEEFIGS